MSARLNGAHFASIPAAHPPLDGVRAIAIGLVIAFHSVTEFVPGGAYGVDLFFVLSAFLITSLIWAECDQRERFSYRSFYWRRICRLLPALSLTVLIVAPTVSVLIGDPRKILDGIWISFAYLNGLSMAGVLGVPPSPIPFNHLWSLAVEEQFYLVWPLAAVFLWSRRRRVIIWLAFALLALSLLISTWSMSSLGSGATYFLPLGHLSALILGVAVAAVTHLGSRSTFCVRILARPLLGWVSLGVICTASLLDANGGAVIPTVLLGCIPVVGSAALVAHASLGDSSLTRLLSQPAAVWVGRRSYGIYLFHTAILYVFAAPLVPFSRTINIFAALAIALIMAEMSYRWFEDPIRRWGRSHRWSGRAPMKSREQQQRVGVSAPALMLDLNTPARVEGGR